MYPQQYKLDVESTTASSHAAGFLLHQKSLQLTPQQALFFQRNGITPQHSSQYYQPHPALLHASSNFASNGSQQSAATHVPGISREDQLKYQMLMHQHQMLMMQMHQKNQGIINSGRAVQTHPLDHRVVNPRAHEEQQLILQMQFKKQQQAQLQQVALMHPEII